MTNAEIKKLLLLIYRAEFDINKFIDIHNRDEQTIEYNAGFEYKDKDYVTHTVTMDLEGILIKDCEPIEYYNPLNDGRAGEIQGGGVWVKDWYFTDIHIEVDGKKIDLITIDDLK